MPSGRCTRSKCFSEGGDSREIWKKSPSGDRVDKRVACADLNLDTHPVVTRLQNEQNQRLEGMEQRMKKIRKSAQQEAERRKFAHLFRARAEDESQTERLLREASLALQRIKNEKELKKKVEKICVSDSCKLNPSSISCFKAERTQQPETDTGDIIPVHVVSDKTTSVKIAQQKQLPTTVQQPLIWLLQPVETFHLGKYLSPD